jgi:ParB family transcriptional regulator, chromosome partitioning protein
MRNPINNRKEHFMTTTTNPLTVPLGKLVPWEGNARRTGAETGLDEIAASIAAHGLTNPLTVRPAAKGRFAVIAGQRRLLALKHLAKGGHFAKNEPISCHLAPEERDAAEISLAENVVRVAMHPADQLEA